MARSKADAVQGAADRKVVAEAVRRLLEEQHWHDEAVAKAVGVSRRTILRWKRGSVDAHHLVALARVAGTSLILGQEEDASPVAWGRRLRADAEQVSSLLQELEDRRAASVAGRSVRAARP